MDTNIMSNQEEITSTKSSQNTDSDGVQETELSSDATLSIPDGEGDRNKEDTENKSICVENNQNIELDLHSDTNHIDEKITGFSIKDSCLEKIKETPNVDNIEHCEAGSDDTTLSDEILDKVNADPMPEESEEIRFKLETPSTDERDEKVHTNAAEKDFEFKEKENDDTICKVIVTDEVDFESKEKEQEVNSDTEEISIHDEHEGKVTEVSKWKNICHAEHKYRLKLRILKCVDCNVRICPICFKDDSNFLRNHFSRKCGVFECSKCLVTFSTECAQKAHERLHDNVVPYVCPDCGSLYSNLYFFINHCKKRCLHMYKRAYDECKKCNKLFSNSGSFLNHQSKHISLNYGCKLCPGGKVLFKCKSRKLIISHIANHFKRLISHKKIASYITEFNYCDFCEKKVLPGHDSLHHIPRKMAVYTCFCGMMFNAFNQFKTHINSCHHELMLPDHWNEVFKLQLNPKKNVEDRKCNLCDCLLPGKHEGEFCPLCTTIQKSCCDECFAPNLKEGFCSNCEVSSLKLLYPEEADTAFTAIAGEEVIKSAEDEYETSTIDYGLLPAEHDYCLKHHFITDIQFEFKDQEMKYGTAFFNTPCIKQPSVVKIFKSKPTVFCFCGKTIKLQYPGDLESVEAHIQLNHSDSYIKFEAITNINEETIEPPIEIMKTPKPGSPDGDKKKKTASKITLLPKKTKKLENNDLFIEQSVTEEIRNPQRKEHEFWDQANSALKKIECRFISERKQSVIDLPVCTSKRIVKKPKRLLEEKDEEAAVVPKKTLSTCSTSPPKKKLKKVRDIDEPQKISSQTSSTAPEMKLNLQTFSIEIVDTPAIKTEDTSDMEIRQNEINFHIENIKKSPSSEELANEAETDESMSLEKPLEDREVLFIKNSFMSNSSPNKRQRKLASKLVYLSKINETDLIIDTIKTEKDSSFTCIICHSKFEERGIFRQHLRTHRTDDNTYQCMECGECFVVHPSLQRHLYAFHKIEDTLKYIEENDCKTKKEEECKEFKCKVCKKVFTTSLDLTKHFRIHGLAFLKQNQKEHK